MEREIVKLTALQHETLCNDDYYDEGKAMIDFTEMTREYQHSGRHTERWEKITRRNVDNKYFRITFELSVKDEMGWSECNQAKEYTISEVFPKQVTTIVYT